MRSFNASAFGIGDLKVLGVLLLASALELKKFLLRANRQTPGLLLRTGTQRAAGTLATCFLVKTDVELRMSMLITHLLPIDTLLSLWTRRFSCHKIYLKS